MSFLDFFKNLFAAPEPVPELSVDDLQQKLKKDKKARLVDVRTPGEYKAVRAPRAENLPLSEISGRLAGAGLPKDTPVYVICHSGNRSRRAAQIMRQAGYDAINVMGGTSEWMRKGHKTTQG